MCVDTVMEKGKHTRHYVVGEEIHGFGEGFLSHLGKLIGVSNQKRIWITLKTLLSEKPFKPLWSEPYPI